jgi:integrase
VLSWPQESDYEAVTLEVEDIFKLLSDTKGKNGEYEIALLVATCGFRISEALGLRWRDIVWDKGTVESGRPTSTAQCRRARKLGSAEAEWKFLISR